MAKYVDELNDVFEKFYKLFYESEDMALKNGIKCLTHTELHIIEAIGEDSLTMNELSDRLDITMGTATVAITKLGEKGFVSRVRSNADRRKVYVSLSKKGIQALDYHNNYHKMITLSITEKLTEEEVETFLKTFNKLLANLRNKTEFLKPLPITEFPVNSRVSVAEIKGTPIIQDYFLDRGIAHYSTIEVLPGKDSNNVALKKEDGTILEVNVLDAKNIIVVKAED
ncbi:MarR family winged helix-turn-helix transcriptional regulator [Fusobacterium sp.]|uniref:MarR family winged helix-turn-helix transcriptional regulator n=1 Tax=Fusobacterium sp. TaxID=68766 RepID=UPI00260497A4|nr:MarR family winged helix-turn-helix transcriptional regulator [Fusobacterium sp.]